MPIETIQKNIVDALLDGDVQAIVHGCNARGVMGSGLALEIKNRLPHAYEDYISHYKEYTVNRGWSILGTCIKSEGPHGIVFNCITQEFYGREKKKYVSDQAILLSLGGVLMEMKKLGLDTIGIPYMFCCDRGGGDWKFVMSCIHLLFSDFNVKIYKI